MAFKSRKISKFALRRLLRKFNSNSLKASILYNLLSITIDSTKVQNVTIDGEQVQEVTIDGNTAWTSTNVNQITTDVTLSNQNISITVYEDTDGDGNAENTETISVNDGTNTYSLSNLDGSSGNTYWIKWQLSNSSLAQTGKANYADLKDVGTWNSSSDWDNAQSENGVVHESVSNTDHSDATIIKQGYSISNPLYSDDLIGYWPLHEDSGSTAYDFSGNNDGNINGATAGVSGLLNTTAYSFGTSDNVTISGVSSLFENSTTLLGWFNPDWSTSSGNEVLIDLGSSSSHRRFSIDYNNRNNNGGYEFLTRDSSGNNSSLASNVSSTSGWKFIAVTYDGSNKTIYVDGSQENTTSESVYIPSGQNLYLSAAPDEDKSSALDIAEVRVYNRALASSEIQNLYKIGSSQGSLTTNTKSS